MPSTTDYYPFGLEMPGRTNNSQEYRYGFNGKEKDQNGEWGSQTHYDYGFRIYNPAIGKFLSVDPLTKDYPWYTPYQFAGNMPIAAIDIEGLEPGVQIKANMREAQKSVIHIQDHETLKKRYREELEARKFLASAPPRVIAKGVGLGLTFGFAAAYYGPAVLVKTIGVNYAFEIGASRAFKGDFFSGIDHADAINPLQGKLSKLKIFTDALVNFDSKKGLHFNSPRDFAIELGLGTGGEKLGDFFKKFGAELVEQSKKIENFNFSKSVFAPRNTNTTPNVISPSSGVKADGKLLEEGVLDGWIRAAGETIEGLVKYYSDRGKAESATKKNENG